MKKVLAGLSFCALVTTAAAQTAPAEAKAAPAVDQAKTAPKNAKVKPKAPVGKAKTSGKGCSGDKSAPRPVAR